MFMYTTPGFDPHLQQLGREYGKHVVDDGAATIYMMHILPVVDS